MKIFENLDRSIIFLHVETTGVDLNIDKIIKLSMKKFNTDNTILKYEKLFNSEGVEIKEDAKKVHGINSIDLINEQPFKNYFNEINEFIDDSHLIGFNIKFGVKVLMYEYEKCGYVFNFRKNGRKILDVKELFNQTYNTNNLDFIYKFLIGNERSKNNIEDTIGILKEIINNKYLDDFSIENFDNIVNDSNSFDLSGWIYKDNNDVYFKSGKHKNKKVFDVFECDNNYYSYLINQDITPLDTKIVLIALYKKYLQTKK